MAHFLVIAASSGIGQAAGSLSSVIHNRATSNYVADIECDNNTASNNEYC
jgi:hypothetical protein